MVLKNIRITKRENLDIEDAKNIKGEFAIIEIRNPELREEFKELPNNSISEYLHLIGEIKQ